MSDYLTNIALNDLGLKTVVQPRLPGWFEPWSMAAESVIAPEPDVITETPPVKTPAPIWPLVSTPDPPVEVQPSSPHQPAVPDATGWLPDLPQRDEQLSAATSNRLSQADTTVPVDLERLLSQLSPDHPHPLPPVSPKDRRNQSFLAKPASPPAHRQPPPDPPNISPQPAETQIPALPVAPTVVQPPDRRSETAKPFETNSEAKTKAKQNDNHVRRLANLSSRLVRLEQTASPSIRPAIRPPTPTQVTPEIVPALPTPVESVRQPKPVPAVQVMPPVQPADVSNPAPTIQVSIGRIEVRATPAPTPSPKKQQATAPVMSLDEYLRQREQGGRR